MSTSRVPSHDERWFRWVAGWFASIRDALEGKPIKDPVLKAHLVTHPRSSVLDAVVYQKNMADALLLQGTSSVEKMLGQHLPASTRSQAKYDQQILCLQALGEMWLRWFEVMRALRRHPPSLFLWMTPDPAFLEAQMRRSVEELRRLRTWRAFARTRRDIAEYIDEWMTFADGYLAANA